MFKAVFAPQPMPYWDPYWFFLVMVFVWVKYKMQEFVLLDRRER
jgi:hypothetical protein